MDNSMVDALNDGPSYEPLGSVHVSPNSGKKTFSPIVDAAIKPVEGMIFKSLEEGISFYKKYARAAGFTVRRSTDYKSQGLVKIKYMVCSKEGFKKFKPLDTSNNTKGKGLRRVPSIRTGCKAKIGFKLNDQKMYFIYVFNERHNHTFVAEEDRLFLRSERGVNYFQQQAIKDLGNINLGPVKAFHIMRTLYGGFDKVGATKTDFKNFKKDMNLHIGEFDAEMMVNLLKRKQECSSNFTCEYITDDAGVLRALFWADDLAKMNFYTFGDVVSFDATYRRNKYKMMFVPFTGIDNHNRNVTLGAAIIGNETAETYSWLLNQFKKAMGSAPPVIVTDQDPAMKKAIQDVFPESRHRLCMWHVMDKLTGKVGPTICNNTDFKKRLCDIVWTDAILPDQFEKEWDVILNDFQLKEHDWLKSIYNIRNDWIPAYYRHERMSGLMRTSSRSESENHFFGQFCNPRCTLVEFLGHFDSAIAVQRHEHRKNDHDTRNTSKEIFSDFVLEEQAYNLFTRTIFLDQQDEIAAGIHSCSNHHLEEVGDFIKFFVKDFSQPSSGYFEVMLRKEDMTIYCTCLRFEQFGLLCCHIFCILRLGDITEFPKQYILRRWTREAVPSTTKGLGIEEDETKHGEDVKRVVRQISQGMESVVNKIVSDFDVLCSFRDHINQFIPKADDVVINAPPKSRRDRFTELIGTSQPSTVTIRVPIGTRFKGCGVHSRLKSKKEQAISKAGIGNRRCSNCLEYGHNIRTCKKAKKVVDEEEFSCNNEELPLSDEEVLPSDEEVPSSDEEGSTTHEDSDD